MNYLISNLIVCFLTVQTLFAQKDIQSKSYFNFSIEPIINSQEYNTINGKIKGEATPNIQIAISFEKNISPLINFSIGGAFYSFGNKFSCKSSIDGNSIGLGIGPDRQNGNGIYAISANYYVSTKKLYNKVNLLMGGNALIHQVYGQYQFMQVGATSVNSSDNVILSGFAYRTRRTSYSINFGTEITLFKLKKVNSIKLTTGYVLGLNTFNKIEAKLFENGNLTDQATITSKGSGFYLGLTYRWLMGKKRLEKMEEKM